MCFSLKPRYHGGQGPLGLRHGPGGWQGQASLWLLFRSLASALHPRQPPLPCLPSFLLVALPLSLPPCALYFLFTLAWQAGWSGSGCELISSGPWQGVAVGTRGLGSPFHSAPGALGRASWGGDCVPGVFPLLQRGLKVWGSHPTTLPLRAGAWVVEELERWPLGGELALCPLLALTWGWTLWAPGLVHTWGLCPWAGFRARRASVFQRACLPVLM